MKIYCDELFFFFSSVTEIVITCRSSPALGLDWVFLRGRLMLMRIYVIFSWGSISVFGFFFPNHEAVRPRKSLTTDQPPPIPRSTAHNLILTFLFYILKIFFSFFFMLECCFHPKPANMSNNPTVLCFRLKPTVVHLTQIFMNTSRHTEERWTLSDHLDS